MESKTNEKTEPLSPSSIPPLEPPIPTPSEPAETPTSESTTGMPQVSVEEEQKAKKIASILARNAALEAEIIKTKAELEEITKTLRYPPAETVSSHIATLHAYNEIRDIGQALLGLVADGRNVRAKEVYEEFGVGKGD